LQLVLTREIHLLKRVMTAQHVLKQVHELFPSSRQLNMTWYNVVKLAQSLYREALVWILIVPQKTVVNFFLTGSYTQQDYIDSMEGATISESRCKGDFRG